MLRLTVDIAGTGLGERQAFFDKSHYDHRAQMLSCSLCPSSWVSIPHISTGTHTHSAQPSRHLHSHHNLFARLIGNITQRKESRELFWHTSTITLPSALQIDPSPHQVGVRPQTDSTNTTSTSSGRWAPSGPFASRRRAWLSPSTATGTSSPAASHGQPPRASDPGKYPTAHGTARPR